jgi:hypothetical protein
MALLMGEPWHGSTRRVETGFKTFCPQCPLGAHVADGLRNKCEIRVGQTCLRAENKGAYFA